MSKLEISPQNIAERKTLILHSILDHGDVILRGDALKTSLFAKRFFYKPKFDDICFLASSKYYEPYFVLGGKYSVDYRKRHLCTFKVNSDAQRMRIGDAEFKSEPSTPNGVPRKLSVLGEELVHYENKKCIILDRLQREVSPDKFSFSPLGSELKSLAKSDLDLRESTIPLESEIASLYSRLFRRPSDISEVVREVFDISQRLLVYRPMYELTFQNSKNGELVTAIVDGITGEVTLKKLSKMTVGKQMVRPDENCNLSSSLEEKQSENRRNQFGFVGISDSSKITQVANPSCFSEKRVTYQKVQLVLGCISLVLGLLAANFALFGWSTPADSFHLLGEYARYACAYGGFGAIIFGSMIINDFIILRSSGIKSQSTAIALEKVDSHKEQVQFIVSNSEEEKESVSQVSSEQ